MATTNTAQTPAVDSLSSDELTAKAVHKRYEGLVMVRNKAIKGKGAWYWAHLEPMLINNADTGLPKAVKLRCSLCDAVFSASNPSRTASEHLKRGTCPNFNSLAKPISSISPSSPNLASPSGHNRKRSSSSSILEVSKSGGVSGGGIGVGVGVGSSSSSYQATPLAIVDPSRFQELASTAVTASVAVGSFMPQQHLVLSGGKEDLGALAMLEYSVKKLKSPKTSPGPTLSKNQIDSALDFLADWIYESCGSVSFSSLEHPKFKAFLSQVGLPAFSRREFVGSRLDLKFEEVKAESEARIRDAMFFQVSSDGWKVKGFGEENLVNLTVNLPNGTSLYRRAAFVSGSVPSKYAEEILWETITGICGNVVQQCVGIVADKFKAKALRNLENQHHWMVNLSCQFQGFTSLIKDFNKELPLFKTAAANCFKLANFVNNTAQIRNSFGKYQLQEYGHSGLLRVPLREYEKLDNFGPLYTLLEDILNSARALQLLLLDESYKMASLEDPLAREVAEMIREVGFWNELEAVHSLVKLIKEMAQEIETERPLVGQCLPLWDDLRAKVKEWCSKFHIGEAPVEKVIERRFKKNYHPAWAAAFILDPLYLIRDTSGKYLPPFKCLTPEQEKDVDKLITRLVSREEAHIALMELMKWRTEGLDPVYARAVQMKERDPITGKMRIANPQSSRLVWETYLTEFKSLGKVAVRLIFLHATSCGFKCNWSLLRWVCAHGQSRVGMERAQKLIFIAAHSKLERRDFSSDEEKDAELFALVNGEDDVLNEVLVDTSSV
ncbi:uncharacterized protein LOC116142814 [Pistacia vera]|uniref:uncharacterized protein LOC116142814 n=1 Tax=Pistacia vera TaxID=55513 RepID=UPI0012633096|nr:uncharacterized protein LOC116119235 isoform X1 [Pistacia vera]XP_031261033.1 uncharacterized protein LOC116119235 isoform X2 [Pistacia vera]XP_031284085.1 uncharacterized protein LOC116142814 [Pistacia vera]